MTQDPPNPSDASPPPTHPEAPQDGEPGDGVDTPAELDEAGSPQGPEDNAAARLAEAKAKLDDLNDKYLRKAAELENTKRRLQRQLDEARSYAIADVVKEMLPVLDDLELALEHATTEKAEAASVETFLDGMNLVKRKFSSVLERHGIVGFASLGKPFDPKVHEAISQQESDTAPDGTVMGEYLKGYMLHDRLLRPALVIVARNPTAQAAQEE
jgi:molecular chaperone GrpE